MLMKMESNNMKTRVCSKCNQDKPLSDFSFDNIMRYYRPDCKSCKSKQSKSYRDGNKLKVSESCSKYYYKNKEKIAKKKYLYKKKRLANDSIFKLSENLRRRCLLALQGKNKSASTFKLIGCNGEFLKKHLELQFQSGMNWDNQGKWHVDHIKPCSSFDLSKPEGQEKCFHYTNLQPLWAKDNLNKGSKYLI